MADQDHSFRKIGLKETRLVTLIAFLAWAIAVYDYILFGTLLPRIEESFGWDNSQALLVSTLVSVGVFLVIILFGPLIDRLGRRKGMMASVGGSAAAGGASALAIGGASLVGIRAFSGVALAEQSVNATYLNEVYALSDDKKVKKNQGLIYAFVQTGWPVGALMAAGFVTLVTTWFGPENWRMAFIISIIPAAAVFLLIYFFLKETPQFVAMKKMKTLQKAGDIKGAEKISAETGIKISTEAPLRQIFNTVHRRNTIILCVVWVLNWMGIQTFSVLGTTVLESGKGVDASSALLMIIVANIVGALGYITHGWLGDRLGRKNVIVGGWLIAGVAFTAMMMGPSNPGFVLPMYMIGLFFLLGPYAAIMYFQAECFQPECRGTGSAFIVSMSQPGAVVGGFILTALVTANFGLTNATIIIALGGVLLSGLIMMFARPVKPSPEPENVGLSKLKNASLAPRV